MTEIPSPKDQTPIDLSSALERIGGDESFLHDLINIYVEDFLEKFERLQKAVETENFEAIKELGHNLKGSSANLSLIYLQEISYEMEAAGAERDLGKAKENLLLLEQEFRRLKEYLSRENTSSLS